MNAKNQPPSLPEADPRSDRFRCGERESKFLAVTMIVVGCLLIVWNTAQAADWPQWRGPTRDGVASKGPKKLWQSDPIPTQKEGGFGSVVVVGSKAYLFVGLKDPLITQDDPFLQCTAKYPDGN